MNIITLTDEELELIYKQLLDLHNALVQKVPDKESTLKNDICNLQELKKSCEHLLEIIEAMRR